MDTNRTLQMILSDPLDGRDDEFNEWYETVHLHDVLSVPGMINAQRFALAEPAIMSEPGASRPTHRYLVLYEMEGDVDEIMGKVRAMHAEGKMHMSETLDLTNISMSFWKPLGPVVTG